MERSLKLPFTFALAMGLYFLGGMFGIAKLSAALKRPCKRSAEAAKDTSWARPEPPMANKAPAFCNGCGALARCYSCATGATPAKFASAAALPKPVVTARAKPAPAGGDDDWETF